jgi:hypothetical protein
MSEVPGLIILESDGYMVAESKIGGIFVKVNTNYVKYASIDHLIEHSEKYVKSGLKHIAFCKMHQAVLDVIKPKRVLEKAWKHLLKSGHQLDMYLDENNWISVDHEDNICIASMCRGCKPGDHLVYADDKGTDAIYEALKKEKFIKIVVDGVEM